MGAVGHAASEVPGLRGPGRWNLWPSRLQPWRVLIAAVLLIAGVLLVASAAQAEPKYPELSGQVTDAANLLNPSDRAALEADLKALEDQTTDQIAIVTLPSLEGYAIEEYAIGLARKWGIGQAGKDNGVLVVVAPNERKVRIEVGRKLEPQLTDTMAKLIITNAMIPKFREGDWAGGIRDGVRDVKQVLLGDAEAVKERSKGGPHTKPDYAELMFFALWVGIILFVIYVHYRQARLRPTTIGPGHARRRRGTSDSGPIIIIPGGSGEWGGGWSGGGGGWSGGGGGFSGGGASGEW